MIKYIAGLGNKTIDYSYNAQGWLKAINHPDGSKDPGKDGTSNNFAPDAFGMTLEYFNGDYSRSGTGISSIASNTDKNYYNGNIVAQSWRSQKPSTVVSTYGAGVNSPAMFTYEYDEQYQFKNNKYGSPNFGTNSFTETVNANREHGLSYDANGNILSLNRTDKAGNTSHEFVYDYQEGTNKLSNVSGYSDYEYDALGQLTHQQKGLQDVYLSYDVSGKVTAIYADAAHTQLKQSYVYDESGTRIKKTDHTQNVSTYYVPDASGNTMAIYDNNGSTLQEKEIPVYATGRIGMYNKTNSSYQYELTDNLGNVRVVINQNKVAGLADVIYYSDYYPYGSPLTLSNNDYRYGYQGQYAEKDKETNWNAFELRNYDAAIGRWLSVDPYGQYVSPYLGMGNNPVSTVDPDGGYGFWGGFFAWAGGGFKGDFKKATDGARAGEYYIGQSANVKNGDYGVAYNRDFGGVKSSNWSFNGSKYLYAGDNWIKGNHRGHIPYGISFYANLGLPYQGSEAGMNPTADRVDYMGDMTSLFDLIGKVSANLDAPGNPKIFLNYGNTASNVEYIRGFESQKLEPPLPDSIKIRIENEYWKTHRLIDPVRKDTVTFGEFQRRTNNWNNWRTIYAPGH